jgi:hypothetical protein
MAALYLAVCTPIGWHSFETGEPPPLAERLVDGAVQVLWFPYSDACDRFGLWQVQPLTGALWLANSILWGVGLYGLRELYRRVKTGSLAF